MSLLEHIVKTDPFESPEVSVRFVRSVDDWTSEVDREQFRRELGEFIKDPEYFFSVVDDRTDRGVAQMIGEEVLIAAYEIAQHMLRLHGEDFYLELGKRAIDEGVKSSTTMFWVSKFFTMGQIVDRILSVNPNYNSVLDMGVERKKRGYAVVTRKTKEQQVKKYLTMFGEEEGRKVMRNNCLITQGMLSAMPLLFKKKEARLKETSCECKEDMCRYELRWGVSAWSKTERQGLIAQINAYEKRMIGMEETMAAMMAEIRHQATVMQSQELTGLRRQAMIGSQATVLAHNIKNPLTGADGYVQLLEIMMSRVEDEKLRKMMQDYLKQVARSVDRAVGLARDIGHYARTGELNLDKRSLQAHYPLNKAMEAFYGRATKAGVEMVKEFEYTGFMRADMRIETVFENLVKNAMEAMPEGGTLTGRTARDGKYVVYVVEDTGKGIPEELQGKLFAEGATMGKDDGTGLGLYSANEIVKAHGGSVGYNSKPGRTAFIIKIPVISDAEPHDSGEYLQP